MTTKVSPKKSPKRSLQVDLGSESLTCGPDLLREKVPNRTKVPNGKVVLTDKF